MISLHMQGGCLCENAPTLRLDTNNVEIAATIAPRPLLMISATGDWTKNTLEAEYPAVRALYSLLDAPDRVQAVRVKAEHNYNKESREAMYAWLARWMKGAAPDVQVPEREFHGGLACRPAGVPSAGAPARGADRRPVDRRLDRRRRGGSWPATDLEVRARALRHALGFGDADTNRGTESRRGPHGPDCRRRRRPRTPAARRPLHRPADRLHAVRRGRRSEGPALRHLQPHRRRPARRRHRLGARARIPSAAIVATGDAALAALLAATIAAPSLAILDVGDFDTSDDAAYVDRLYVPGLRRAGRSGDRGAGRRGRGGPARSRAEVCLVGSGRRPRPAGRRRDREAAQEPAIGARGAAAGRWKAPAVSRALLPSPLSLDARGSSSPRLPQDRYRYKPVSKQEFQPSAAGDAVRAALAAADRRRRAREASRLLWRAAPVIAGAGLAVAVLRRWTLWSAWTPALVLIAGAAALARLHPDRDAGAGALRSGRGGDRSRRRRLAASCAAPAGSPRAARATSGRTIISSSPRPAWAASTGRGCIRACARRGRGSPRSR